MNHFKKRIIEKTIFKPVYNESIEETVRNSFVRIVRVEWDVKEIINQKNHFEKYNRKTMKNTFIIDNVTFMLGEYMITIKTFQKIMIQSKSLGIFMTNLLKLKTIEFIILFKFFKEKNFGPDRSSIEHTLDKKR